MNKKLMYYSSKHRKSFQRCLDVNNVVTTLKRLRLLTGIRDYFTILIICNKKIILLWSIG